jgi:hypothetical protein
MQAAPMRAIKFTHCSAYIAIALGVAARGAKIAQLHAGARRNTTKICRARINMTL